MPKYRVLENSYLNMAYRAANEMIDLPDDYMPGPNVERIIDEEDDAYVAPKKATKAKRMSDAD